MAPKGPDTRDSRERGKEAAEVDTARAFRDASLKLLSKRPSIPHKLGYQRRKEVTNMFREVYRTLNPVALRRRIEENLAELRGLHG